jgi:hypothetical protein
VSSANEAISVYGLLFGDTGDWTIAQFSDAFRELPDRDLFHGMGLGAILGLAFHQAFGDNDSRTLQLVGSIGPLGQELERRGHDPMRFNFGAIFADWRSAMAAGGEEVAAIPTHRLSLMRSALHAALARFAVADPENDVRKPLEQAFSTVDAILQARGVVADVSPQAGFQA